MSISHSTTDGDSITIKIQMTSVFCLTDDFLKNNPKLAAWRNSNNDQPRFTDAEVITLALMQPIFGVSSLKRAYLLTKNFFSKAFPKLPSYAQFLARLHALAPLYWKAHHENRSDSCGRGKHLSD